MNVFAFLAMGFDKLQACRGCRRVPEKAFFLTAAAGGSLGILAGMYVFRHKIRNRAFALGLPAIIALQAAAYYLYSLLLRSARS